jgi:HNH endonuclease
VTTAPGEPGGHASDFFARLQHLLAEGEFVSTYKFALLLALTRWAVEHAAHDERQPIDVGELAPYALDLYWPQLLPFGGGGSTAAAEARPSFGIGYAAWQGVLAQERARQKLAIQRLVLAARAHGADRWTQLPADVREQLLRDVRSALREQPLWKLHEVAGGDGFRFLYRRGTSAGELVFEPGVIPALAAYSNLVEDLVRGAWLRFVLRCNPELVGHGAQVELFLFPDQRASLVAWRQALLPVHGDQCFYCGGVVRGTPDVDHFLPWAKYPRDLGHNFVFAHAECNQRKSDHLAGVAHLRAWRQGLDRRGDAVAAVCRAAGLPHDRAAVVQAASTLYATAARVGARAFEHGRGVVPLGGDWRDALVG